MARIEFSRAARADPLRIYGLIATEGGATRADAYLSRIERHCRVLAVFPEAGRRVGEKGTRALAFERRIMPTYRVRDDAVIVPRVLHGGRLLSA